MRFFRKSAKKGKKMFKKGKKGQKNHKYGQKCTKFGNILKKGRWLYAIIACNKLVEKALWSKVHLIIFIHVVKQTISFKRKSYLITNHPIIVDSRHFEFSRGSENCLRYWEFELSRSDRTRNSCTEKVVVHTTYKQIYFFKVICYKFLMTVLLFSVSISTSNWRIRFCILESYFLAYRKAFCGVSKVFSVSHFEGHTRGLSSITISSSLSLLLLKFCVKITEAVAGDAVTITWSLIAENFQPIRFLALL